MVSTHTHAHTYTFAQKIQSIHIVCHSTHYEVLLTNQKYKEDKKHDQNFGYQQGKV